MAAVDPATREIMNRTESIVSDEEGVNANGEMAKSEINAQHMFGRKIKVFDILIQEYSQGPQRPSHPADSAQRKWRHCVL
jgi:hypothetical protein